MTPDPNKVGQSVFYDCIDASPCVEIAGHTDEEPDSKLFLLVFVIHSKIILNFSFRH